jgi:hypothetical protein
LSDVDATKLCDINAERGLLGSVFVMPECLDDILSIVRAEDFFDDSHQAIFAACAELHATRRSFNDPILLVEHLKATGRLETAGGTHHIAKLINFVPNAAHFRWYAEIVREKAILRNARRVFQSAVLKVDDCLPVADILDETDRALVDLRQPLRRRSRFKLISAAELAETTLDIPFLIDDVLAEGQPCLCAGGSKSLKTSTMVDLALSLASGGHWLGHFPAARPTRTALLSGESGRTTIAETAHRICRAAGRELASITGFFYDETLPRLAHPADVADLARLLSDEAIRCVIVDPAFLAMDLDGRESSIFAVGSQLRPITEECQRIGCTLIIAHHTKQSTAREPGPPQLGDTSWAGFEQFARQWILLKRRKAYVPGSGEHKLWLATGGSAGHGGLYHANINEGTRESPGGRFWQVSVAPAADATGSEKAARQIARQEKQAATTREHVNRIAELLANLPEGQTARSLREAAKLSGESVAAAIALLLKENRIEQFETVRANRRCEAYRLI